MFRIVKDAVLGKKGKDALINRWRNTLQDKKAPESVWKIFDDEANKYAQMDD